jgi:hypothetical protein
MNVETAMIQLAAYREGKLTDPRLSKAMRCIENESFQRERLAEQVAFDLSVMEMLGAIAAPPDLRQRLATAQSASEKPPARPRHHLTAILSLGLGVAIIIAVLVFFHILNRGDFPGRDNLQRITAIPARMTGDELEPVSGAAGELGDWFYMHKFEGYRLPPELRSAAARRVRLLTMDEHPIAQVWVELGPHQSFLYVFKGEDFGVTLPSAEDWTVFSEKQFAAAARSYGNLVVMITFQGTEADMQNFLPALKKEAKPHSLTTSP